MSHCTNAALCTTLPNSKVKRMPSIWCAAGKTMWHQCHLLHPSPPLCLGLPLPCMPGTICPADCHSASFPCIPCSEWGMILLDGQLLACHRLHTSSRCLCPQVFASSCRLWGCLHPSVLPLVCTVLHQLLPSLLGCVLAGLVHDSSLMPLWQRWNKGHGRPMGCCPGRRARLWLAGKGSRRHHGAGLAGWLWSCLSYCWCCCHIFAHFNCPLMVCLLHELLLKVLQQLGRLPVQDLFWDKKPLGWPLCLPS